MISACLQDALVAVGDLAYDPDARVFLLVANRFRWEDCRPGIEDGGPFERTLCGVTFDDVAAAAYRGFQRSEKDRILSLLAIRLAADAARASPALTLDLDFAGGRGDSPDRLGAARSRPGFRRSLADAVAARPRAGRAGM